MSCNPHIFRSYDIRGVVDADLTPEVARLIGQGFGTLIQQRGLGRRVAIGRDVRASSPALHGACVEGVLSTGCDVIDIGIALTPMMYFSLWHYEFDAGINVTGSHNPVNENGFKLAVHPVTSIFGDDIQEIRRIIESGVFATGAGVRSTQEIAAAYLAETAQRITLRRPPRVVMDCGNGTVSLYAPQLYRMLGCTVEELYCTVDSTFPHHLPDPQDHANMQDLAERVLQTHADLGIAFDGDGDRVGMVDAAGVMYPGDVLMIPLVHAALRLHPGASIVADVKSTQVLLRAIEEAGGKAELGETGPPYHKRNMKKYNAPLAGEISGHYFISDNHWGCDDGLFAGGRILQALDDDGHSLHDYLKNVPQYVSTPEIKVPCPDDKKFEIVREATAQFQQRYPCVTVDGVRVSLSPTSWALVRASNTTPNLTVRFEGKTTEEMELARKEVTRVLHVLFGARGLQCSLS